MIQSNTITIIVTAPLTPSEIMLGYTAGVISSISVQTSGKYGQVLDATQNSTTNIMWTYSTPYGVSAEIDLWAAWSTVPDVNPATLNYTDLGQVFEATNSNYNGSIYYTLDQLASDLSIPMSTFSGPEPNLNNLYVGTFWFILVDETQKVRSNPFQVSVIYP